MAQGTAPAGIKNRYAKNRRKIEVSKTFFGRRIDMEFLCRLEESPLTFARACFVRRRLAPDCPGGANPFSGNRPCMVDLVLPRLRVGSKKALLEELARIAAPLAQLDRTRLLAALQERERIGCTGIGQGVALPHARFAEIRKPVTVFSRLASPIVFESIDGRRVDLVYLLLGPEIANDEHLKTLARAARLLRDATSRQDLRHAKDEAAIRAVFSGGPT
jgi:PTS system nitrogen regulatory IIA component